MKSAVVASSAWAVLFACLLLACAAHAQRPANPARSATTQSAAKAVPATDEPFHHPVRSNEYVRVEDVTVPPHQQTLLHEHTADYFAIMLGPAQIENDVVGQRPVLSSVRAGQTRVTRGGFAHVVKNVGETPFHNLTIELLKSDVAATLRCGAWKQMCENGGGDVPGGGMYVWSNIFETASITATHAILDEKSSTRPFNGSLLLVALGQCRLRAGDREIVLSNPGETSWIEIANSLALRNLGAQQADFLVLQFAR